MTKWEYKYIRMDQEISMRRKAGRTDSAEALEVEVMNYYGSQGWEIRPSGMGAWLAKRPMEKRCKKP